MPRTPSKGIPPRLQISCPFRITGPTRTAANYIRRCQARSAPSHGNLGSSDPFGKTVPRSHLRPGLFEITQSMCLNTRTWTTSVSVFSTHDRHQTAGTLFAQPSHVSLVRCDECV